LLLLPIAWNLLKHHEPDPDIHASRGFWAALRAIIVADALMGLDNVLAIAGASKGHLGLVVLGLLISVPLVVWGSTLILKLIQRFPFIIYVGAAAVAWTAARMITQDPITGDWFAEHLPIAYLLDAMLVASTSIGGWLMNRRRHA
jgi:YjbE family integral membrane protein